MTRVSALKVIHCNPTRLLKQTFFLGTSTSYDAHSYDDRWYNLSDPNILRGRSRALAGHQTWNQDHQNNNLANNSGRTLKPVCGTNPRPLQSSAHNIYQYHNRQANPACVSHHGTGMHSSNTAFRSKSQSYSATYGTPRGYQVQNQNINPICNPPPIRTQFTRSSRGWYPQNGTLRSPARPSSRNLPFSQHGNGRPPLL